MKKSVLGHKGGDVVAGLVGCVGILQWSGRKGWEDQRGIIAVRGLRNLYWSFCWMGAGEQMWSEWPQVV